MHTTHKILYLSQFVDWPAKFSVFKKQIKDQMIRLLRYIYEMLTRARTTLFANSGRITTRLVRNSNKTIETRRTIEHTIKQNSCMDSSKDSSSRFFIISTRNLRRDAQGGIHGVVLRVRSPRAQPLGFTVCSKRHLLLSGACSERKCHGLPPPSGSVFRYSLMHRTRGGQDQDGA